MMGLVWKLRLYLEEEAVEFESRFNRNLSGIRFSGVAGCLHSREQQVIWPPLFPEPVSSGGSGQLGQEALFSQEPAGLSCHLHKLGLRRMALK